MCPTILIVDDHDAVRTSLLDWFGTVFPDCALAEARSGEEAVELALARPPDVILMDIGLPQMSGIEAARRIKAAAPQVQVVMLTIHETPEYQADAAAAGVTAYILKRQMYRELIPTLQRLLSSSASPN